MYQPSRRDLLTAAMTGLALPGAGWARDSRLLCGVMDVPPWVIHGQARTGIAAEMVARLSDASGLSVTVEAAPQARLSRGLLDGQIDLLIFVQQSGFDAKAVSLGAIGEVEMGFVTRAGMRMDKMDDFAGRTVAVVRSSENTGVLRQLPPVEQVEVRDLSLALAMIAGGRVDAYMGSRLAIEWHMRQTDTDPDRFGSFFPVEIQPILLYLSGANSYPVEIVERLTASAAAVRAAFPAICAPYLGKV